MDIKERSELFNQTEAPQALDNLFKIFMKKSEYGQEVASDTAKTVKLSDEIEHEKLKKDLVSSMAVVAMFSALTSEEGLSEPLQKILYKTEENEFREACENLGFIYTEHALPLFSPKNMREDSKFSETIKGMESFLKTVGVHEEGRPSVMNGHGVIKEKAQDLVPLFLNTCAQCITGQIDLSQHYAPPAPRAKLNVFIRNKTDAAEAAHEQPSPASQMSPDKPENKEAKVINVGWGLKKP